MNREGSESPVPSEEERVFDGLNGATKHTLKAYYKMLKRKAEYGTLSIAKREVKAGIGSELLRRDELFELIVTKQNTRQGTHVSLRLYFAEPPSHEDLLLAIGFTRKPSKADVGGTQDGHIREAYTRLDRGAKLLPPWGVQSSLNLEESP